MIGGDPELLDARFLVAVDSGEEEEKLLGSRQTSDEVVRGAKAEIGVSGLRRGRQQFLGILVRLADLFQTIELLLINRLA